MRSSILMQIPYCPPSQKYTCMHFCFCVWWKTQKGVSMSMEATLLAHSPYSFSSLYTPSIPPSILLSHSLSPLLASPVLIAGYGMNDEELHSPDMRLHHTCVCNIQNSTTHMCSPSLMQHHHTTTVQEQRTWRAKSYITYNIIHKAANIITRALTSHPCSSGLTPLNVITHDEQCHHTMCNILTHVVQHHHTQC